MSPEELIRLSNCLDCAGASRRDFLKTSIGSVAAIGAASAGLTSIVRPSRAFAADNASAATSETLVQQLYSSLRAEQKKIICFPFDHPLRSKVDNNWHIIKQPIADVFDKDQEGLDSRHLHRHAQRRICLHEGHSAG